MLETISEFFMPALALVCVFYLNRVMNKQLMLAFALSFFYVYSFGFIQDRFGWWTAMDAVFNQDIAAVMAMVCALLSTHYKIGLIALVSMLGYAATLIGLNLTSWFDVFTTAVVCLPCWILFSSVKSETKNEAVLDI